MSAPDLHLENSPAANGLGSPTCYSNGRTTRITYDLQEDGMMREYSRKEVTL